MKNHIGSWFDFCLLLIKLLKGRIIVLLPGIITELLDPESVVLDMLTQFPCLKVELILTSVWFYFPFWEVILSAVTV